jgi:sulfoacetaldehyde dehydrogenase
METFVPFLICASGAKEDKGKWNAGPMSFREHATSDDSFRVVADIVARAKAAQTLIDCYDQVRIDELTAAAGWAILEPSRNRRLAELAVTTTGLGNVADKITKNHRKTLGLLRDLKGAASVGVISTDDRNGIVEIARPVGVVAAITPSTNPAATPANKIINALKGRNAIVIAPSPKGWRTCETLLEHMHAEFRKIGAPRDLVQMLPAPITKDMTLELMRRADLVVATGSQANIRAAYASGTPAYGVGAGNVASIIDASADLNLAALRIVQSKTFDNATSCSSENSVIIDASVYDAALDALASAGGVLLAASEKSRLQRALWLGGKLSPALIARDARHIAQVAALDRNDVNPESFLMVEESGIGPAHPFSGEKLSPVLAVYKARDFDDALRILRDIYAYQGAGHSVGLHSANADHALRLGLEAPASRVIVNQPHAIATGGSFENGLPFSLSMGCGSWGRNSFSDNLNYRHFLNIVRISRPIPGRIPTVEEVIGDYISRHGE